MIQFLSLWKEQSQVTAGTQGDRDWTETLAQVNVRAYIVWGPERSASGMELSSLRSGLFLGRLELGKEKTLWIPEGVLLVLREPRNGHGGAEEHSGLYRHRGPDQEKDTGRSHAALHPHLCCRCLCPHVTVGDK